MTAVPSIIVTVGAAAARRGAPTSTGRVFMAYASAAALTPNPLVVTSAAAASAAGAPDLIATYVGVALQLGAPDVLLINAAAADEDNVTAAEWKAAFALAGVSYGPGTCIIPGVSTSAAHSALNDIVASTNRVGILDAAQDSIVAATLAAEITGLAAGTGAKDLAPVAPWVNFPGAGGAAVAIPGSVAAAGRAAAQDASEGNAGHAVMWRFGDIPGALSVTQTFTDAELAVLDAAGINVIKPIAELGDTIALFDWKTVAQADDVFTRFNYSRLMMEVAAKVQGAMSDFIGEPIDPQGHLYARVAAAITGDLTPLSDAGALSSFDVVCDKGNNPDPSTGQVVADVDVTLPGVATNISVRVSVGIA